jgi:hypothetical protein
MNRTLAIVRNRVLPLLVILALAAYQYFHQEDIRVDSGAAAGNGAVEAAFTAQRSGVWLEAQGPVARILSDDNEGSRHQRFVLELDSGHTVLVAHNIDLAGRVPLARGDLITLRGRYEWNERGGVIHWTHHDPDGRGPGGWVKLGSETYR